MRRRTLLAASAVALGLGALLFGETPDLYMIIGSAMVVGSGVYTFLRERYHASKRAA